MAQAFRQINPDVMPVYPITPQTTIISTFARFQAQREVETEIMTVESEHSAMSAAIGAAAAGARTVTATSSQGLALMNEELYIASGMRLPILMVVSARALSSPLNIHADHSDVMGARDAGWIQIFSESNQEIYDTILIGIKMAENSSLPVMAIMDGFFTSHTVMNMEILPDEDIKKFTEKRDPDHSLLKTENPETFGALALPDSYFEFKIEQDKMLRSAMGHYRNAACDFEKISGRFHDFFEIYGAEDAENIIIIAGSAAGTAKEAVKKMRAAGKKAGVLKIKMFRPFPHDEIATVLKNAKNIAVLDRAMSFGTYPPLYGEILRSMRGVANENKFKILSYVYGLGGRDIFQKDIENVFENLAEKKSEKEINFIRSIG